MMAFSSIEKLYEIFRQHRQVTTDSRNIKAGDIFFALKGEKFDGNQFALKALEEGAAFAVVDDPLLPENEKLLVFPDALDALQQLAAVYRSSLKIPVIAITGSNGKTTTKELIHSVLSASYQVSTTKGNLNNHIGIPLTLLRIPENAELAVVEMGANHQKEIAGYCHYTRPTHGMITNCGKAHLEGFGGVEGVRKGKGELFDFLVEHSGQTFVCADFDYFHDMVANRKMKQVTWYGTQTQGEVIGRLISAEPFLKIEITSGFEKPIEIETRLVGDYNIYNVLAAVTIGRHFGVPAEKIQSSILAYVPDNSRSQLIERDGNAIIMDAYNANPTSMAAAIKNLALLPAEKKVLILGAMAELGEESLQEHQAIVNLIEKYSWFEVILVGGDFGRIRHPFRYFPTAEDASLWWNSMQMKGATILLKGSRSMTMEKVLQR